MGLYEKGFLKEVKKKRVGCQENKGRGGNSEGVDDRLKRAQYCGLQIHDVV
jgi:hypothetical protein